MDRYLWDNPYCWLENKIHEWPWHELVKAAKIMATLLSSDQIQDLFECEMAADGFYDEIEEARC